MAFGAILKAILRHPVRFSIILLFFSIFFEFARILVFQFVVGTIQDSIQKYPNNFPHGFFIPFFYSSILVLYVAATYRDYFLTHLGTWRYVLPIPLTLQGRWCRIVGVPLYAFLVGIYQTLDVFFDPTTENELGRIGNYLEALADQGYINKLVISDIVLNLRSKRQFSLSSMMPAAFVYIRLPSEIFLVVAICFGYSIGIFCNEPRHDTDELREATRNNDMNRVQRVLARNVDPNCCGEDGATALHICAQQAIPTIAKLLLDAGANPNIQDHLGFTPLHWAVQLRREEVSHDTRLRVVRMLIENGANYKMGDTRGRTPFSLASKKENEPALEVIREVLGDRLEEPEVASLSSTIDTVASAIRY